MRTGDAETGALRRKSKRQTALVCFFIAAATLICFWPVVHAGFIDYDDSDYVTDNPHVLAGLTPDSLVWALQTRHASNWHPLTWWSHMLDAQMFGPGPMGPHCVNLALHVANALLLFLVLRKMTGAIRRSAFVAALFALHPLHVESVAWVSERKDVLSTFFWMLTLWAYAGFAEKLQRKTPGAKVYYGLAVLCFALGLMSKPMLVTLPFVLLLLDYWPLKRIQFVSRKQACADLGRLVLEKAPFLILTILACAATVWAQQGAIQPLDNLSFEARLENSVVSYARYLGKIFWPAGLAIPYLHRGAWPLTAIVPAAMAVILLSLGAIARARKYPFVVAGWFWFLGTLIPVIGLLQVGAQSMADRYTYVPAIGIFVIIAWGMAKAAERWRFPEAVVLAGLGLILATCGAMARQQSSYWTSTEKLFHHTEMVSEKNYVALGILGLAQFHEGNISAATNYYLRALEINPASVDAMNNMGVALGGKGNDESLVWYHRALQLKPLDSKILYNLGNELASRKEYAEACEQFEAALKITPDEFEARNNLANTLVEMGRLDEGLEQFEKVLRVQRHNATVMKNMAGVLLKQDKVEQAILLYRQAIKEAPKDASTHYLLGQALAVHEQWNEAIQEYVETLQLAPGNPVAEYNLGYAFRVQKRLDEARQHLEEALRLQADFPLAHYNLGCVLVESGHPEEAVAHFKEALREKPDYHEAEEALRKWEPTKSD